MKKVQQTKNIIPADFKPRIKWIKKANMWVLITIKDGKIAHEWFSKDNKPTL